MKVHLTKYMISIPFMTAAFLLPFLLVGLLGGLLHAQNSPQNPKDDSKEAAFTFNDMCVAERFEQNKKTFVLCIFATLMNNEKGPLTKLKFERKKSTEANFREMVVYDGLDKDDPMSVVESYFSQDKWSKAKHHFIDQDLEAGASYQYRVTPFVRRNNVEQAGTAKTVIAAPVGETKVEITKIFSEEGMVFTNSTTTGISAEAQKHNLYGVQLMRSAGPQGPFTAVDDRVMFAEKSNGKMELNDSKNMKPGEVLFYRVELSGMGPLPKSHSETLKVVVAGQAIVPTISLLRQNMEEGCVEFFWHQENDNSTIFFDIERKTGNGAFVKINREPIAASQKKYQDFDKLNFRSIYEWRVIANYASGKKLTSASSHLQLAEYVSLPTPEPVVLKAGIHSITLTWNLPKELQVFSTYIFRSAEKNGEYKRILQVKGKNTYHDTDLDARLIYWYKITFTSFQGKESGFSTPVGIKPLPAKNFAVVEEFRASSDGKMVLLNWKRPHDPYLTGYRLYRKNDTRNEKFVELVAGGLHISQTSYYDQKIAPGMVFSYRIHGIYNDVTEGPPSPIAAVNIPYDPLGQPRGIRLDLQEIQKRLHVRISWNRRSHPLLKGYRVYRREDPLLPWQSASAKLLEKNEYNELIGPKVKSLQFYVTTVDIHGKESAPSEVVTYIAQ